MMRLDEMGQKSVTGDKLRYEVLMQYPNLNVNGIYNSLMIPSQGMN